MSGLYQSLLSVHVIVAIFGLGSVASIAVIATIARTAGRTPKEMLPWLGPLLRYSAFSLAIMLVTGIALDLAVGGAFRKMWWFRGSVVLLFATGALHGQARRAARPGNRASEGPDALLPRIGLLAYAMCALIAVITVLMELKPF